jgi:2-deoxy-D-gluconate 3-dehydrogenase
MKETQFRIDDKVTVITGASKGIGNGLSKELAAMGAKLVLCARNEEELNQLAQEIIAEGDFADVFVMDINSIEEIRHTFEKINTKYGAIDILINNAGLGFNHAALDVTEDDWDQMMDVNMKGLFFCCQQAGKHMIEKGSGRIINMSSQASLVAIKDHAVYCASKGGVNMLTKVLALEWANKGITVNGIAPTFTYTPGTAERLDNPEYLSGVLERIPAGKVVSIQDITSAVLYLTSNNSSMVTGTTMVIDGGWTIQ